MDSQTSLSPPPYEQEVGPPAKVVHPVAGFQPQPLCADQHAKHDYYPAQELGYVSGDVDSTPQGVGPFPGAYAGAPESHGVAFAQQTVTFVVVIVLVVVTFVVVTFVVTYPLPILL